VNYEKKQKGVLFYETLCIYNIFIILYAQPLHCAQCTVVECAFAQSASCKLIFGSLFFSF